MCAWIETVEPEGEHWYLTMAHGKPNGLLYKYATGSDELVGETELGLFPATMQISTTTGLLYCVNCDLHGDMSPSSVSIVDPDGMVEVARTTTGPMPHGSRVSPDGLHHYSCSMLAGRLYEIDARQAIDRLKGARNMRGRKRAAAARLAAWRETEAIRLDRPRQRIARDTLLLEIAHKLPRSTRQLAKLDGMPPRL